ALDLALVQVDAHDLSLDLVGDVGELGPQAHARREVCERIRGQVREAPELVPPGIREVLVEDGGSGVLRTWHHPAATLLEEADTDLATELMVDVPSHAEREVDLLR